ncbi:hypothetical protein D9611_001970 [Ephemerocybe angulata]|uniref:Amidohydrolase 3 domain-containing protein n=1 Tax=Ephemerocybe angulata TaxID=980116 RepID=A0A8H5FM79_9AGAR|nr:hypothetical protein D9611_001970 [Tulosesus angulatus]
MTSMFKRLLPVLGLASSVPLYNSWLKDKWTADTYIICSPTSQIYTVATPERVECVSVGAGRIIAVGSLDDVSQTTRDAQIAKFSAVLTQLPFLSSGTVLQSRFLDLVAPTPKTIHLSPTEALYPGFTDAHAHVIENGYMLQLPLSETTSLNDVIKTLEAYVLSHPEVESDKDKWIEGMGWDQTKWNEGQGAPFPTAADLDESPILSGRPISLSRIDGHAKWVSPRVLEIMSSTGTLPPPSKDDEIERDGGKILRGEDGRPTGIFMDKAMNIIPAPEWSEEQMKSYFNQTATLALQYGLTSIHDADTNPRFIKFYQNLAETGTLPLRLYLMGYTPSTTYWGNDTSAFPKLHNYGKHRRLNLRAVKLFTDGALGSWGAALLEPYSDNPDTTGIMQTQPEILKELVGKFWEDGWQTNIHCIGDRANKAVLDIFEGLLASDAKYDVEKTRPRIEHAQIFEKGDLERIGRLGVIASVQPTHATSDMWYAESRLGPERIQSAYAYQTLLQASPKHVLPLGSDFPVEGVNPLLGFYAAVSRLSHHSESKVGGTSPHGPGGWYPAQKLTRAQALKGMTLDPAYASFAENEIGSLEVGKKADFTILDRDIMREDESYGEILEAKVKATVVDGGVVYGEL